MEYENPYDWYFSCLLKNSAGIVFGAMKRMELSIENFLFNIRRASQKTIPPTMHPMDLNKIEADLDASGFDDSGGACDMGVTSYTLLIYDPTKDIYRRKILKTKGDSCLTSKSSYTQELLSYFK